MNTKFIAQIRRHLFGLLLLGMMLSICLGISSAPIARAHGAATESPTALPIATDTAVEAQAPIEAAASSCTTIQNGTCTQTQSGLSLCRLNNICVVKVDLNENSLRPRVVIAPNGGTSWLSSMASNVGAYAAINGDYFSGCPDTTSPLNCGEGLTFIDGTDYTDYTGSEWQNRRSLGFNDNYDPNIGWPGEQGSYHRQLLAGGPQVTFGGEYRWRCWYQGSNTDGNCACQNNTVVINDELFGCSANNWWNRPQTFVAFSDDRNTLYLAVSEPGYNKTPHEMHDVLWVQGARYALKMDGGGSSGMYFNSGGYSFAWDGGRAVANAWVIVPYSPPPPTATPPPNCNPNADQMALFVDTNYGGQCVVKGIGEYANPGAIGLPNDAISSLKVGGNVQAVLCRDDNFGGGCETFTGDDPNLGDNSIGDNQVSSVKVESNPVGCNPNVDQIALFVDSNYGGQCVLKETGDYPNPSSIGLPNDSISSIKVGGNVKGILCQHDNFEGTCETFTSDDPNLSDNSIGDNQVSSAKVQLSSSPTVVVTDTWTSDENWNQKTTFNPGDDIKWVITVENTTGSAANIELTYDVQGPDGLSIAYWNGTVSSEPGVWFWGLPGIVPQYTGGTHTFVGYGIYLGQESQASTTYFVTGSPPQKIYLPIVLR